MVPKSASNHGEDVVALLIEQRDLCRRLAGLAETQRALITGNEPERLLDVLASRQEILDRLTEVGRRLQPFQQNWRGVRAQLTGRDGQLADALVAEVNGLLQTILQKDEADGQLLSARKQATGDQVAEVSRGRAVGAAYAAAAGAGASRDWTE